MAPLTTVRAEQFDDGRILLLRVADPDTELITSRLFRDLHEVARRLAADPVTRSVIITGPRPGVFLPHFDMGEIAAGSEQLGLPAPYPTARALLALTAALDRLPGAGAALLATPLAGLVTVNRTQSALTRLGRLPQAIIAAINGDALGGGCEVALACDVRVMSDGDHLIGLPEVSCGIPPGAGGSVRLVRTLGAARARAMVLQARPLAPAEAAAAGLVDRVVAPDDLLPAALAVARRTARWSRSAVLSAKRAMAATMPDRVFRVEAAGFVSAAADPDSLRQLRAFAAASTPDGSRTPWRDRSAFS